MKRQDFQEIFFLMLSPLTLFISPLIIHHLGKHTLSIYLLAIDALNIKIIILVGFAVSDNRTHLLHDYAWRHSTYDDNKQPPTIHY